MQFLFSTPLNEKVEKINNTRCNAISKTFRTIKIYLVLIEIDNSRNNAILVGNPNPKFYGGRTYRTLHIPGNTCKVGAVWLGMLGLGIIFLAFSIPTHARDVAIKASLSQLDAEQG